MKFSVITVLLVTQLAMCSQKAQKSQEQSTVVPIEVNRNDNFKSAYFASGCFWCVEAIFEHVRGVKEAVSGYSGGKKVDPNYRQVSSGNTGHAETVEVIYNPAEVSFETLVKVYYGSQDPTTYGQSPDFGSAYRSIIFYQNLTEKEIIEKYKLEIQKKYTSKKVRTEVMPFQKFWKAEAYHQDFEKRNPSYPYILRVSIPRLNRFKNKFPELVKG